jgi:uncharacterized protein (DUF58 family)
MFDSLDLWYGSRPMKLSRGLQQAIWVTLALGLLATQIDPAYVLGMWPVAMFFVAIVASNRAKDRSLRAAPSGSTRIEATRAIYVNGKVEQYARAGWTVVDQSSAKSFGSEARVTITFRKA